MWCTHLAHQMALIASGCTPFRSPRGFVRRRAFPSTAVQVSRHGLQLQPLWTIPTAAVS